MGNGEVGCARIESPISESGLRGFAMTGKYSFS